MVWVTKEPEAGRFAQFMAQTLEPAMGEMLQRKVFDPKTNTGELGCTTCHELIDASGTIVPHAPHAK